MHRSECRNEGQEKCIRSRFMCASVGGGSPMTVFLFFLKQQFFNFPMTYANLSQFKCDKKLVKKKALDKSTQMHFFSCRKTFS